ncbi:MAG: flagellum-specific peptidoglycan hydrolase FlgJ [Candidatus Paceibacteria bacterium]|jgi:flagellum-specific peptidoglycan hydrolase FlgJ
MLKKFLIRKMMKSQLKKANIPAEQQEMLIEAVSENPDFFQEMAKEAEKIQKEKGIDQMSAMMQVMEKNKGKLQGMFKK